MGWTALPLGRSVAERPGVTFTPVPDWLARVSTKELSSGAKFLYARLRRYAAKSGVANPTQATLAGEMGIGVKQVSRYVSALQSAGLITVTQLGLTRANRYEFASTHPWMCPEGTDVSDLEATDPSESEQTEAGIPGRSARAGNDRSDVSGPRKKQAQETSPKTGDDLRRPVADADAALVDRLVDATQKRFRSEAEVVVASLTATYDRRLVESVIGFATADGRMRRPNYILTVASDWGTQRGVHADADIVPMRRRA
jgi:hypothetical protein